MLAALSEKDYWSVLNEQKFFEKALQELQSGGQPKQPVAPKATKTTRLPKPFTKRKMICQAIIL